MSWLETISDFFLMEVLKHQPMYSRGFVSLYKRCIQRKPHPRTLWNDILNY